MTSAHPDRLYELLPVVHRLRDADRGYPLRALLKVITEQVDVVDRDIAQLYENWFVETCQDWVVPYIGDLIGTRRRSSSASPRVTTTRGRGSAGGFSFRVVRWRTSCAFAAERARWPCSRIWPRQLPDGRDVRSSSIGCSGSTRTSTTCRCGAGRRPTFAMARRSTISEAPSKSIAHSVDVRSIRARHFREFFDIPSVGVFVWRLKTYSVTDTPAYCEKQESPNCFVFSVLGNSTPLCNRARTRPAHPPGKLDLRRPSHDGCSNGSRYREPIGQVTSGLPYYYGPGKSFSISTGSSRTPVDPNSIVVVGFDGLDLPSPSRPGGGRSATWAHCVPADANATAERLGHLPLRLQRRHWRRRYRVKFRSQPSTTSIWSDRGRRSLGSTTRWLAGRPMRQSTPSSRSPTVACTFEPISITLKPGQTLQLRAASGRRPVIRLLNWQTSGPDNLTIAGERDEEAPDADPTTWFTLDGIVVTGRGVQVQGAVAGVTIRHSTLVPGWGIDRHCRPTRPTEPSLVLDDAPVCVGIEHSIVGAIQVNRDEVREDPVQILHQRQHCRRHERGRRCRGSTGAAVRVLGVEYPAQHRIRTGPDPRGVAGRELHFHGRDDGLPPSLGCMRFCYVPPGSRTPKRFACQPDMVERGVLALAKRDGLTGAQQSVLIAQERQRVEPQFDSVRYGTPTYARLSEHCAEEIGYAAPTTSRRWACFTTCISRSGQRVCAPVWMNTRRPG